MKPIVGDSVHYVSALKSRCYAAIVAVSDEEPDDLLTLYVIAPNIADYRKHVAHDESGHAVHTWHWPERPEA